MKKYDSYKNSGIDWIGSVPTGWNPIRLSFVLDKNASGVWGDEPKGDGTDIFCYRVADFDYTSGGLSESKLTLRSIPQDQFEGKKVNYGDLLLEKSGGGELTPVGRVVRVNLDQKAVCSNFIQVIHFGEGIDNNYMYYYFYNMYAHKINGLFFNQTIGIQNLKVKEFLDQIAFLPSIEEQYKISSFLDSKCSIVDELVLSKKRQIAILFEYRKSIISEAVTHGLSSNAQMKESSIEWIDVMPSTWKVSMLNHISSTSTGLTFTKADLVEKGNAVISYGQIHSKLNPGTTLVDILVRYVPDRLIEGKESAKVNEGDFIFADTSEDLEGCGNCVLVDKEIDLYAGYHTTILRLKDKSNSKYLSYLFQTDAWRSQLRSRVNGVKLYSITQGILKHASVILPPIDEQKEITDYLDQKCERISNLLELLDKEIKELEKYKTSIICEAVTGKVKVF